MATYAMLHGDVVNEVVSADAHATFNPTVQAQFVQCPDNVTAGFTFTAPSTWAPPAPVALPTVYTPNFVSVPVFKLLFTPQEEVGIYGRVTSDPQISRFVALVDDVKTTQLDLNFPPVQERIKYLGTVAAATPADGLPLSAARISQILEGVPQ